MKTEIADPRLLRKDARRGASMWDANASSQMYFVKQMMKPEPSKQ